MNGVGLHTGKDATLTLSPGDAGTGIIFRTEGVAIPAAVSSLDPKARGTNLTKDGVSVKTVEHLLAACSGLGITDLCVDLDGPEIPAADGSALGFARLLEEAQPIELEAHIEPIKLREPIEIKANGSRIKAIPASRFTVEYVLSYPDYEPLKRQSFSFDPEEDSFLDELAPARTFCLEEEVSALRASGLGQGGSLDNAVVVGKQGFLNPTMRYENEPCRHKALDLFGDLSILGRPVLAAICGEKSGHVLNGELLRAIDKQANSE